MTTLPFSLNGDGSPLGGGGIGSLLQDFPDLLQKYSPEAILEQVRIQEESTSELRDRWDKDLERYRLKTFTGLNDDERGYKHYTSPMPRAFAKKILSWLSAAELLIKIQNIGEQDIQRRTNDAKERFAIGILRQIDDTLKRMIPSSDLRSSLSFNAVVRGYVFTLALLTKEQGSDRTIPHVQVFDPRNTFWGMDGTGPQWICHKVRRTREEILTAYGVDIGPDHRVDGRPGAIIYDYWDGIVNVAVMQGETLKPPTPHFSPRMPVAVATSGYDPISSLGTELADGYKDVGESIFSDSRGIYDNKNDLYSIQLELAARARNPTTLIFSPDGSKTLDGDPHIAGGEIALTTQEKIEVLQSLETTKDFAQILALVSGEEQRATLPNIIYGEAPFAISGVAMQNLRQGIETQLIPPLIAVENSYLQIVNLLADQFSTGIWQPMELSGFSQNRDYFSDNFDPQIIQRGGDYSVQIVPQLPQDDLAKWSMAQLARTPDAQGRALVSDRFIREDVLAIQDSDAMSNSVKEQMAEMGSPMAQLHTMMSAAQEQGRPDLAQIYLGEMMVLIFQQMITTGLPPQFPPPHPGAAGAPDKVPQQVASSQAQGVNVPQNPVAGPQVPAQSPRPGAQSPETAQLNSIGLVGPGG